MGKTGSGKSNIALFLCSLIDPTEGEILIDGKNLKDHNLENYRNFHRIHSSGKLSFLRFY
jgi:ATP-binding cassette subfamily B protein